MGCPGFFGLRFDVAAEWRRKAGSEAYQKPSAFPRLSL
jgi:hypothetical protein